MFFSFSELYPFWSGISKMLNMLLNEPWFFFSSHYWFLKINFVSLYHQTIPSNSCSLVCHRKSFWTRSFHQGLGSFFCWTPFPLPLIALGMAVGILLSNRQKRDWSICSKGKQNAFWAFWEVGIMTHTQKKKKRQKKAKGSIPLEERKTFFLG